MRVPQSWLSELVGELPSVEATGEAFVRVGFEVEEVHGPSEVTGPVVVGRVVEITELTEFKKPIRFCRVEVGEDEPRGIVCGARNFAPGDLVVVTLPGAVLPGGFAIAARTTYGRVSDGMIASARELGIGADHAGILVLPPGTAEPGADARPVLGLDDSVIELDVNPDSGYCFSLRGLAREMAAALDVDYSDPVARVAVPVADGEAWPVVVEEPERCPRFVARRVDGVDPARPAPWWMQQRLLASGMRPISLVVDVTNYVMLELGQPLHAFDAGRLAGPVVVRRAREGEQLTTLDDVTRTLDPDDLLVTDDSGPVALAGVMGGASTEIAGPGPDGTIDVLLEGAHWEPTGIARTARRHKLPSEASKRFERGVDPRLPPAAVERAAQLLVEHGGGTIAPGRTDVGAAPVPAVVRMPLNLPDRVAGVAYPPGATVRRLAQVGCRVELVTDDTGSPDVVATPPSWRPDLQQAADLVEEVLRLEGLDVIPSVLPAAPGGRGSTPAQRRRRAVSRALAEDGYVEVLPFPFVGPAVWDAFGLGPDDVRRRTVRVLNPLDAERAELATTLLPGLLDTLVRNRSRGAGDLALFHVGQVVLPHARPVEMPDPPVDRRPTDAQYAQIGAALPAQPL
ncbi:MAG: Phenylalanyl-tRNA synthetase beta chain, partial [uncultured Pseudonocardia sp.]